MGANPHLTHHGHVVYLLTWLCVVLADGGFSREYEPNDQTYLFQILFYIIFLQLFDLSLNAGKAIFYLDHSNTG